MVKPFHPASRAVAKFGLWIRGYLSEVACASLGTRRQQGAPHKQRIGRNDNGCLGDLRHQLSCQDGASLRWYSNMEVSGAC